MNFQTIPKVELHCHLDGSLSPKMVQDYVLSHPTPYSCKDAEQLTWLEQKMKAGTSCASLAEYLEKFDLPLACLQTEAGLKEAAKTLIADVAKEQVRYIEVRFAPALSTSQGLSCRRVIECVLDGLAMGGRQWNVEWNVIACAMRHHSLDQNLTMAKAAREFLGEGVCAVDLAGDEAAFPTSGFLDLIQQTNAWGMPLVIHAGECGSTANVREAMELGAKRIGHGVALIKDEEMMREFARRNIGIEMCPTSNLQTRAIDKLDHYPLRQFLDAGIPVSVHTDNRTVSQTTLARELEIVYEICGRSDDVIRTLIRNAIETSLADDSVKHRLLGEKF